MPDVRTEIFSEEASGEDIIFKVDRCRGYSVFCEEDVLVITRSMVEAAEGDPGDTPSQIDTIGKTWPGGRQLVAATLQEVNQYREALWVKIPDGSTLTGYREF